MKRFELHILPTHGLKLTQDAGDSGIWEEQSSEDGSMVKLKTSGVSLFGTGNINCGWESYTRPTVLRKRRGMHTWTTPCTSTSTTTETATKFEVAHNNHYGQFISAVRDNEWWMVPYGTYSVATGTPYYEYHTSTKLTGTATATIIGTDTTTATVTCTAGSYPCLTQYGSYTLLSSINNVPWKWQIGDATASALITSGSMYKFKYLATFYNTIFGAFDGTAAGAISIRYTSELPTMSSLSFAAANQLYKPDEDYGITGMHAFGRKALLIFGRKSICGIDYYSGYTPRFAISLLCNGVGTMDHNSVVMTDNAIYFFDRMRGAFIEYTGGSTYNVISDDIQKLLEDLATYSIDVTGWYDPKYDIVSWSIKSTALGYYDFGVDDVVSAATTYASSPVANFVVKYHRPTKQWFPDSQRLYDAVTGYDDFILKGEIIQQVSALQRSREIVIPNYDPQMYYEIEEFFTEQTVDYPLTRVEPILWHPFEDRHKRIQEVRMVFGGTTQPAYSDNFSGTWSTTLSYNTGWAYAGAVSTSAATAPYDDDAWINASNAIGATNGSYARVDPGVEVPDKYTHLLICKGYDFSSIPSTATIVGVTCKINALTMLNTYSLCFAKLLDANGAVQGSDIVSTNVAIGASSPVDYAVGASNSVWGATLTPTIVQDADFGVAISFITTTGVDITEQLYVDSVALNIYYTVAYSTSSVTQTEQNISMEMSCYHSDNKNMTKSSATLTNLGLASIDSNNECVFYTDIDAKYYQLVWGQSPTTANGLDCPVSKIIVKGYVY